MEKTKITASMTIGETLKLYPAVVPVFMSRGLHCLGCPSVQFETIGQAASVHGIDLAELLKAANDAVKA